MKKPDEPGDIPQADALRWMGLCPCGCGVFRVAIVDEHDKPQYSFGFTHEGWLGFMDNVLKSIDREEAEEDLKGG